jgi:hypothetical protein
MAATLEQGAEVEEAQFAALERLPHLLRVQCARHLGHCRHVLRDQEAGDGGVAGVRAPERRLGGCRRAL